MRVAVIGAGRMGALHARNLAADPRVRELVVYDTDTDRAVAAAQQVGAAVADSLDGALAGGTGACVVAAATPAHADMVRRAVTMQVPVLCEKPLATTVAEASELVRIADNAGISIQVGAQRRCDPELSALRLRLRSGRDGPLIGLRVVSCAWRPPSRDYLETSDGLFADKVVHDVDLVRWLTGREVEHVAVVASAAANPWIGEIGDADTAAVALKLTGGVITQIWVARQSPVRFELSLDVVCADRLVSAGRWLDRSAADGERGRSPWADYRARFATAYALEVRGFLDHVCGDAPNMCPPADALRSEVAAAAAEEAWRSGRIVRPQVDPLGADRAEMHAARTDPDQGIGETSTC